MDLVVHVKMLCHSPAGARKAYTNSSPKDHLVKLVHFNQTNIRNQDSLFGFLGFKTCPKKIRGLRQTGNEKPIVTQFFLKEDFVPRTYDQRSGVLQGITRRGRGAVSERHGDTWSLPRLTLLQWVGRDPEATVDLVLGPWCVLWFPSETKNTYSKSVTRYLQRLSFGFFALHPTKISVLLLLLNLKRMETNH